MRQTPPKFRSSSNKQSANNLPLSAGKNRSGSRVKMYIGGDEDDTKTLFETVDDVDEATSGNSNDASSSGGDREWTCDNAAGNNSSRRRNLDRRRRNVKNSRRKLRPIEDDEQSFKKKMVFLYVHLKILRVRSAKYCTHLNFS